MGTIKEATKEWIDWLQSNDTDIFDLTERGVIEIESTMPVGEAFKVCVCLNGVYIQSYIQILVRESIQSAPVWDNKEGRYIGFIDVWFFQLFKLGRKKAFFIAGFQAKNVWIFLIYLFYSFFHVGGPLTNKKSSKKIENKKKIKYLGNWVLFEAINI